MLSQIIFGRDLSSRLDLAEEREWLVTNGIGGYAMGTIAGALTRCYHGLLVAALSPPLERTLLVTKLDETLLYPSGSATQAPEPRLYPLHTNRWTDGAVNPHGYRHIERFSLEGSVPTWRYACADLLLEKRIWMQAGANTTYIYYQLQRATHPVTLTLEAMVNYRDHHSRTRGQGWSMMVDPIEQGVQITAFEGAKPIQILSDRASVAPNHDWFYGFELIAERDRGLDSRDDHLHAATFQVTLKPGESCTIIATTENRVDRDGEAALKARRSYEQKLLGLWKTSRPVDSRNASEFLQRLVLAADQFIVNRASPQDPHGKTIIAGYPWFSDWGRDTMISLPGLTLATGRPEVARSILRTYAHYMDQGMIPNRFPDVGETPDYNTVDATLWFFEALRAYHAATNDDDLIEELFPVLSDSIDWHCRGTRYNIHLDSADGLLYAGEPGLQLTWMDAKIGDWVVTPRMGKPIEINALWYNALRIMARLARTIGRPHQEYEAIADRAKARFSRFWIADLGYCYDLLDGPDGDDDTLRPNQILTVSLPESPFTQAQQRSIVDVCGQALLSSYGLRSLSPDDPHYRAQYQGDPYQRDSAYHQGTVWGWLLGAYTQAHLRIYRNPARAREFLEPMIDHLSGYGVGSLGEIFDGDPPFAARGCIAQAWTVAEVLRTWLTTEA